MICKTCAASTTLTFGARPVLWLLVAVFATAEEFSLAGKSVYFIVVDRFARSGEQASNTTYCDLAADWMNNTGGGYCGGTLNGIINHLDYIEGMGFDCIWITPVVDSNGFMGYDAENIFEIESHFGSKEDLKRLSNKLHERSMCLILDIVLNHVRPLVINGRVNLSTIVPFNHESHYNQRNRSANQSFEEYLIAWPPPPFNPSEDNHRLRTLKMSGELDCGHHVAEHTECACFPGNMGFSCPSSSTADIATGYLGVLGDLNHSNPFVRQTLLKWVREMVQNYSLDALRLDTAIYLERDFLPEVQEAAAVQVLGEATVNNLTYQASLMHGEAQKGLLGLLNFPPFYQLPRAFCGYRMGGEFGDYSLQGTWYDEADMTGLGSVLSLQLSSNKHSNLDMMGNFADNHDEYSRLAYFCRYDSLRIRQALVWVFLTRGIPILYYGTEQGLDGHQGPHNNKGQDNLRESLWQTGYRTDRWQYRFVRKLNMLRKHLHVGVGSAEIKNTSKTTLIFTRETTEAGTIWVFLNNAQNATEMEGQIYCPGPSGRLQGRWFDALSGKAVNRYLKAGCFEAPDRHPKILFRKGRR
eukprot:symbB.v1.2.015054.t1/scaffold1112.1/size147309/12